MNPLVPERNSNISAYVIAALSLLVFLSYYPVLYCNFINYDDPFYVTSNSHVRSGLSPDSIRWAFTSFYNYNWHPLTWLSHMLDVQLTGLNPAWHHLTNLLLHIGNTALLFLLLKRMTGTIWKSACVAALFGLHPLHVESVAWVSERKDVLSALFGFLSMLAYVEYARSLKIRAYLLCLVLFVLGLMAKPMLITLPFVLLLLDYWPLKRLQQESAEVFRNTPVSPLILEKLPLIVFSILSGIITWMAQQKGGALSVDSSMFVNFGNAVLSYATYILKMFWPVKLAVFYPFDPTAVSAAPVVLALAVILLISATAWAMRRHCPWLTFGWLWYLGTLVPVIGFVRIGQHALSDRYTYLPMIGLFVMAVWGIAELSERWPIPRGIPLTMVVVILAACSLLTNMQTRVWQDSTTLFRHALEVTDNNWLAHKNLAAALATRGEFSEALEHVSESLRIKPEPLEYVSQGWLFLKLGQHAQAVQACRAALAMSPADDKARFILGLAYLGQKDYRATSAEYDLLKRDNSPYAARLLEELSHLGITLSE